MCIEIHFLAFSDEDCYIVIAGAGAVIATAADDDNNNNVFE